MLFYAIMYTVNEVITIYKLYYIFTMSRQYVYFDYKNDSSLSYSLEISRENKQHLLSLARLSTSRRWDLSAFSVIKLLPFVFSLIF